MNEDKLGLFNGEDKPSVDTVWDFYEQGKTFNQRINLDETVKANELMYIGKQWEGKTIALSRLNYIHIINFHFTSVMTRNYPYHYI